MVTAPAKAQTAATPWGASVVVEEVAVPQRAGDKRFSVVVQLLETRGGERLVRFAYTTAGSARRGPVTMRARDLERLRAALERAPVLAQALESASADSKAREDP
ncbi:MAG TPA: hypothetical protein VI409_15045 [Gaiellaceae bacterium]|nr:hypothetical protein [Gaiellaceae bacterium]